MSELLRGGEPAPELVVFNDLDNTLLDADECLLVPHEVTHLKVTGRPPGRRFRGDAQKAAGGPAREVFRYLYRKHLRNLPEDEQEEMLGTLDSTFGQEVPNYSHLVKPIPGVKDALEQFTAKGVIQVIVTHRRPRTVHEALERGGIDSNSFSDIYARDRVEELGGKAGAILDFMAREEARGLPAVMVGDAVGDMRAGVEARIRSVGVLPPGRNLIQQIMQWRALKKAGAERVYRTYPRYGHVALRELKRNTRAA